VKPDNDTTGRITLEFDDNQVLPLLYGHHNSNLAHIEKELNVRLDSFGNIIQISGQHDNMETARNTLEALYQRMSKTEKTMEASKGMIDDALRLAKTVTAKSKTQQDYVDAIDRHDVIFGVGPAGTGKTYLAVAKAVEALKARQVERIILSRPAVEAGERLGFLPGDMKEKVDPYLRPLYDALYDMMPSDKMDRMLASGQIEIAPLAFMRGRTLAQAFVIIDEAQNTTPVQMKMVLTRLGDDSKMVITGDLGQVDLPNGQISGLAEAVELLDGVKGIDITTFTGEDVVRHPVVARILTAYDKRDQKKKA
jgi:phosphate starvation-inducible PhoH-like protein